MTKQQSKWPAHFQTTRQCKRISKEPLSGIVHSVREIRDGVMIALCGGAYEWINNDAAVVEGRTTCERCLRIEAARNRRPASE